MVKVAERLIKGSWFDRLEFAQEELKASWLKGRSNHLG